ncbi:tetratricopeptide repeat protein [Planctomycetota bacterium]
MTANKDKKARDVSASELPSDQAQLSDENHERGSSANLIASGIQEVLSEYKVSVSDKDSYGHSTDSRRSSNKIKGLLARRISQRLIRHPQFSWLQKAIAVTIIIVASMLMYALFRSPIRPVSASRPVSPPQEEPVETVIRQSPSPLQPSEADYPQVEQEQIQESKPVLLPTQPRSIEVARSFYMQGDYRRAYATYEQLLPALPTSDQFLRDYLQLEMALCAKEAMDLTQASQMLSTISHSRSLAVRIMANYHLCLLEMQRKRFLRAATRAYSAIALIKAIDFDEKWALSFESDCHFMVAECLSRRILFLSNTDVNLPNNLWDHADASFHPFDKFGGIELRRFLRSGSEKLDKALLGPSIRKLEYPNDPPRWSVISYGAPLEELMAKFAAVSDLDVHWAIKGTSELGSAEEAARQRAVTLYLPAATSRQVALIAAGCAGLLAYVEDNPDRLKVTIHDPVKYSSLDEYLSLIGQQAISLWQKFVLMFHNDDRLGNAHFVMGFLQNRLGRPTEAMAEYKLVANRFSQTSLAPYALLHSSQVKSNLHDYHGARGDLKQLIEQYPDNEIYEQAYWHLADATMEAGLDAEAAGLYQRVHNFGFSLESKTVSALRAARCFYKTKAYENAAKWLTRYINLARDDRGNDLYFAYFLLGQTNLALGKYQQACHAFQHVLVEESPRQQYIEAVAALIQSHIEREHFVEALNTLENLRSVSLSEDQSVEMMLLKSKIFRMLGLISAAIDSLQDRAGYISDKQLNAKISFELALCHIAKGELEHARSGLSEILSVVESGPLARETAQVLSDVCLELDQDEQAISVCLKLLDSDLSTERKQHTLKTLATAYRERKEYDKAALALSGQWE